MADLLYISPVIPAVTGNGLAMRAGMVLEALAARYSVSLLVNPLYPPAGPVPEFFTRMCRDVAVGPSAYRWQRFDVVHVFRLASLPAARPFLNSFLNRHARHHLDLDDIESETHRRVAALCLSNGDKALAFMEEHQAAASATVEAGALPKFERIYVCSAIDREKLAARVGREICILPNSARQPAAVPPRPVNGPFLFVGTLGYYPNEDACRYLRNEIVPRLSDSGFQHMEFQIVGTGATDRLRSLISHASIRIIGEVPQVDPWYHNASAVVVPIRAGGGTRIKILEAFSFRRPVITTTIGAEGIDAKHDQSLLIADTPEQLCRAPSLRQPAAVATGSHCGSYHARFARPAETPAFLYFKDQ
jgi:glycosyltransferase involved in cell wall biosynthesis